MKIETLLYKLISEDPSDIALVDEEIDRILRTTPAINPGFELPEKQGVVRYDSNKHTASDVAGMTSYLQKRIAQSRSRNPVGRLVLTQTEFWPGDCLEHRRALISVQHGLTLVSSAN